MKKGCLTYQMRRTVFIALIVSTISTYLHSATIQTSYEYYTIGSEPSYPASFSGDFSAVMNNTNEQSLVREWDNDGVNLGSNGILQLHEKNEGWGDLYSGRVSWAVHIRRQALLPRWDISVPVRSFSGLFQYFSNEMGNGTFRIQFEDSQTRTIVATELVDMRGIVGQWLSYSFSSEQQFDRITFIEHDGVLVDDIKISTESVPEPNSLALLALGGLALAISKRRRA